MLLSVLLYACVSTTPVPPPRTIEVVRGDTLSRIAGREDVTVDDLMRWNGLTDDRIDVGQHLVVSDPAGSAAPPPVASASRPPRPSGPRSPGPAPVTDPLTGPAVPSLKRPSAKPCLSGPDPSSVNGDFGMATSAGLTVEGTSRTMNGFLPKVSSCLVDMDPQPTSALNLEIQVACTGLVTSVTVQGSHDWPPENAACLRKALRFASFPAHARPDGDSFLFPLRLQ